MYDLIIVGAGPAGATLARLLEEDYKILLLDKKQLAPHADPGETSSWEKCCGGLIAPDAQRMLARMGLGVPREVLVGPQLFTVRTIDVQHNIERYYQRHYINIDRGKFDSWLVSLLAGTEVRLASSFKSLEQSSAGIRVKYTWKGQEHEVWTKFLVGADGAASAVRRRLKPETKIRKYISIQEWFRAKHSNAYYSAIFDREITDFYSWTIPKEEYLLVGAALIPNDNASGKFELLKQKLENYGFDLREKVRRTGAFILRPESPSQIYLGQGNVALIGEAAGWISPTSAEGLSYAFRSALAFAASYREYGGKRPADVLKGYYKNTGDLRLNIRMKNLKAPFMFNQGLRKMALRSGLLSIDIRGKN